MSSCASCTPEELCGSVDCTVQQMIHDWPSLFENRTQALYHLFCVLGGGYEWEDGGLVTVFPWAVRPDDEASIIRASRVPKPPDSWKKHDPEEYQREMEAHEAEKTRLRGIRARAAELALTPGPLDREPQPYSDRQYLETLPADIRPDWAAAAAEIDAVVRPLLETREKRNRAAADEAARVKGEIWGAMARLHSGAVQLTPAPLSWALTGMLRSVVLAGHDVHEHPKHPANFGVWQCTVCGDLGVTPEDCPGWAAHQTARTINGVPPTRIEVLREMVRIQGGVWTAKRVAELVSPVTLARSRIMLEKLVEEGLLVKDAHRKTYSAENRES